MTKVIRFSSVNEKNLFNIFYLQRKNSTKHKLPIIYKNKNPYKK